MACNFITDIAENGTKFKLIFETDDKEVFTYMLEAARDCIDHNEQRDKEYKRLDSEYRTLNSKYIKLAKDKDKVIDEFIEKVCDKYDMWTEADRREYHYMLNLMEITKDELKKKYTESEDTE